MRLRMQISGLLTMSVLLFFQPVMAELATPNASGVAMGHVHLKVHDVESNLQFWTALGGKAARLGDIQIVQFPDIIVALSQGDYRGNSHGAVVDHIAFRVKSLERIEQSGFDVEYFEGSTGVATVRTPEGESIELFDEQARNLGFAVDSGQLDDVADRHNRILAVPITSHHIHLNVPESDILKAKNWYVETFGGVAGKRWHYEAVDLPGINLNFSAAKRPVSPTKGRMVDHIGFEIEGLEAFCQRLIEKGVSFDIPYTTLDSGIQSAFLTDPWGTYIELTEGLNNLH